MSSGDVCGNISLNASYFDSLLMSDYSYFYAASSVIKQVSSSDSLPNTLLILIS